MPTVEVVVDWSLVLQLIDSQVQVILLGYPCATLHACCSLYSAIG